MNRETRTRGLAVGGLIAALYTALGICFAPIGFGPIQFRVAEALTLLPILTPHAVWGLTLGCALTNLYGLSIGANIIGILDIFLGSAATLAAALITHRLRGRLWRGYPILPALPPVLVNALVVGGELTYVMAGGWSLPIFLINVLEVGLGQFLACYLLGLPLLKALERTGLSRRL